MLSDPIEKHVKSKKSEGTLISSALTGRGSTGVNLCWYNRDEFKQLTQEQKDESILWQTSAEGKVIIKANKNQLKADCNVKKRKFEGGGGSSNKAGGGGDNGKADKAKSDKAEKVLQKKYQAVVAKAAKKLVASSIEAERAESAAANLSLEAAIKRQGGDSVEISATSVIKDNEAVAEKELTQKQTQIKLSSVMFRINRLKKDVFFGG